jgi:predicted peptidase
MRGIAVRAIAAVAVFVAAWCVFLYGDTGFLDRTLTVNGETLRYQVYVPIDWTANRSWPVLVHLHGNGAQGADGLRQTSQGTAAIVTAIRQDRRRFPVVIVFPQAQPGTRWSTPRMEQMVLAQLAATTKEFNGDPARTYLAGFSMGGQGVMRMAARSPERFAALVEVAGRLSPRSPNASAEQIAEDVKANPYLADADPFRRTAELLRAKPLWIFHGDADMTVPVSEGRRFAAAMKSAGAVQSRYTELAGAGHIEANEKAWADPALMEWLLAQRLAGGAQ